MRYTLADLEKRFGHKPNARWSSIANELRREQTAERLREEIETERITKMISDEALLNGIDEGITKAMMEPRGILHNASKPSYFDSLMKWVR